MFEIALDYQPLCLFVICVFRCQQMGRNLSLQAKSRSDDRTNKRGRLAPAAGRAMTWLCCCSSSSNNVDGCQAQLKRRS